MTDENEPRKTLTDRNQASAYYTLVDRPDGAWKALRAALTPAEEVEG